MSLEIDEVLEGINIEMKNTDDREIAKQIVMQHLAEDPNYYKQLDQNEIPDPRGDGPVVDTPTLENGQSNIINYSNKEPLLFQAGENSSHDYPGKIVINNESNYVDREVKKNTIPGPAATGSDSVGNDTTQPTLPTGGPRVIPPDIDTNKHGDNFNHNLNQDITVNPPEATRKTNEEYVNENESKSHPEKMPTVDPDEEGLHNTGKDLSRTGPGGNKPEEDYNSTHYEGQGEVKINLATPYQGPDAKKIYDVDGTIPELQEDVKITIEDPLHDEFDGTIEILIDGKKEEPKKELKKNDLKNHPGRKDSGTHINTIKAGEQGIEKLIPISDIWKEKNDGIGMQSFEFKETIDDIEPSFEHASSFVGKVRYFPRSQQMAIILGDKNYDFCGIAQKDFDSFAGAPSKGAHFNRQIKQQFNCSIGLSEALNLHQHKQPDEFNWIKSEEIENMKKYSQERGKGKFILAVASGESVTDHRPEGVESLRRRWTKKEMMQNIRTAKGKLIDLNHMHSKIDPHSGGIYDANWNDKTEKGEVIIWETDEKILDAIRNDIIGAVSINTGKPRRIETNCTDGECFIEPEGTILGEENGVALAYVVTASEGFDYHGQHIPGLPPGMKFTKIYLVE